MEKGGFVGTLFENVAQAMSYMADPFRLKALARTSGILRLNSSEYSKIVRVLMLVKLLLHSTHIKGEENDAEQSAYYMRCRNTTVFGHNFLEFGGEMWWAFKIPKRILRPTGRNSVKKY